MSDKFQNRFIEAMKIRGMRQTDIADKSGLDKAQISQYKNGKHEPMQDALHKLATALNVNVAWLMGHDVPMEMNEQELKQKFAACELIEKCYGSKAYQLVEMFIKLNDIGKEKIIEQLSDMTQLTKYTKENKTKEEKKEKLKMA